MENDVRVTVIGWVCSEPQVRSGPSGEFLSFRMGSTPRYRRNNGEYADLRTEWFDVKVKSLALLNNVRQSIKRSDPVLVVGRLSTHQWEAKDGTKHWAMQIQAETVGHDLRWGDTRFGKVPMAHHRRGVVDQTGEGLASAVGTPDSQGVDNESVPQPDAAEPTTSDQAMGASQAMDGAEVNQAVADMIPTVPSFEAPPDLDYPAEQVNQAVPLPQPV